jgi:hypothetical protein
MADDGDPAEIEIDAKLELTRQAPRPASTLLATGCCHYCDEPLHNPEGLFCDNDCSQDYDLLERALAMYCG